MEQSKRSPSIPPNGQGATPPGVADATVSVGAYVEVRRRELPAQLREALGRYAVEVAFERRPVAEVVWWRQACDSPDATAYARARLREQATGVAR